MSTHFCVLLLTSYRQQGMSYPFCVLLLTSNRQQGMSSYSILSYWHLIDNMGCLSFLCSLTDILQATMDVYPFFALLPTSNRQQGMSNPFCCHATKTNLQKRWREIIPRFEKITPRIATTKIILRYWEFLFHLHQSSPPPPHTEMEWVIHNKVEQNKVWICLYVCAHHGQLYCT